MKLMMPGLSLIVEYLEIGRNFYYVNNKLLQPSSSTGKLISSNSDHY